MPAEKAFQRGVIDLARLLGWSVFYVRDSRGSPSGWPDLVLVKGPRLLYRELKTDTGRLSRDQLDWGRLLTAAGADYAVWRPSGWELIESTLKGQLALEAVP